MQTTITLLMRDGTVYLAFRPSLSPAQYAELRKLSELAHTGDELRTSVANWAAAENLRVHFDELAANRPQ